MKFTSLTFPLFLFFITNLYPQQNFSSEQKSSVNNYCDSILSKMTIEEKAGQVVFPAVFGQYMSEDNPNYKQIVKLVKEYHVGGLIFLNSNIYDQAIMINKMQSIAKVPLLISADYERGLSQNTFEATSFPYNMGIGAADDSSLTYEMGKIIAEESKSVGVFQNYAPVSDVNNNPNNPIINVRSFGENVELVKRLSNAFLKGIQDGGIIATSKHFPGHGNTSLDSHKELPIISGSKDEINKVELAPFKSNIENGVQSIMVGHLEIPALEKEKGIPATLSKSIITDLLKNELGFKGLIVTDAMNMHAITNQYSTAEATIKAIEAGNDCILYPEDPFEAIDAIIDAVKNGVISENRLNESVRKILAAKKMVGLDQNKFVNIDEISKHVGISNHWKVALELARKSITLVRNENNLIPINRNNKKEIVHIILSDEFYPGSEKYFDSILKEKIPNLKSYLMLVNADVGSFQKTLKEIKNANEIILSIYLKVKAFSGNLGLTNDQADFINKIFEQHKKIILLSHGNPYILSLFSKASTYLCNYGNSKSSELALAEAIFGEIPIKGKLPISIPNANAKFGDGQTLPQSTLKMKNNLVQFDDKKFKSVDELINQAIKDSAFPGANLLIAKDGEVIYEKSYGHYTYDKLSTKVSSSTIYDLASVSKVIATTTAAMICIDRKLFQLDDKVSKYISKFGVNGKENITIRNLLLHNTGLPAFKKYYEMYNNPDSVLMDIYSTKLDYPTGTKTVYSDLGMITLGKIIEKVSGKTLDQFCKDEIFDQLGMNNTFYKPSENIKNRIAPTEYDNYWRKRLLIGEVNDETASMLNGVAGHAGLFSTTEDLAVLLQMLLQKGYYQGKRFIDSNTVKLFVKKQSQESSRALGWDTKSETGSSAGNYFSNDSYGHTGYTGTSVWTDPHKNLIVIFLTNRVYPTRNNTKILKVRPALHDEIIKAISEKELQ